MKKILVAVAVLILLAQSSFASAQDFKKEEANKKVVLEFYEKTFRQKNFEAASKFLSPHFIEHNPMVADGVDGLRKFVEFLAENYPLSKNEIRHVFADGDYVILHVHAVNTPRERGDVIVDIFKLEDGKIVEHWDVIQPVPDKAFNSNGMF